MNKTTKFSPKVREHAVRMVLEQRGEHGSLLSAVQSIAPMIGCLPNTLYESVRRHEVDAGERGVRPRPSGRGSSHSNVGFVERSAL